MAAQADGLASRYASNLMNDHVDGNPFRLTPINGAYKPTLCIGEATAQRPVNPKILEEIARVMIGPWDGRISRWTLMQMTVHHSHHGCHHKNR